MSVRATRRDVLKLGGAAAASMAVSSLMEGVAAAGPLLAPAWKNLPIGTQAWCVRMQLKTDIPGTLAQVSKAGFELLELENAFGKSGAEWKTALDAAKLKAAGFHHIARRAVPRQAERDHRIQPGARQPEPDHPVAAAGGLQLRRDAQADGRRDQRHRREAEAAQAARRVPQPHDRLQSARTASTWWNRFADVTSKDVVLQFDTGNASEKEGVDVVEVLKRNPGRVKSMHIKPFSKASPNAFLGADELKWPAIMTAAETVGRRRALHHRVPEGDGAAAD